MGVTEDSVLLGPVNRSHARPARSQHLLAGSLRQPAACPDHPPIASQKTPPFSRSGLSLWGDLQSRTPRREGERGHPNLSRPARGTRNCTFGEGLPLVQLAHEFLGVKGGTLQGPGVWLLRGARLRRQIHRSQSCRGNLGCGPRPTRLGNWLVNSIEHQGVCPEVRTTTLESKSIKMRIRVRE